jgi:hypothetical protein
MLPTDCSLVNNDVLALSYLSMTRKNPAAVALGRMTSAKKAAASARNARKAVKARMAMTEEQRSAQARKAAAARWGKKR